MQPHGWCKDKSENVLIALSEEKHVFKWYHQITTHSILLPICSLRVALGNKHIKLPKFQGSLP